VILIVTYVNNIILLFF